MVINAWVAGAVGTGLTLAGATVGFVTGRRSGRNAEANDGRQAAKVAEAAKAAKAAAK